MTTERDEGKTDRERGEEEDWTGVPEPVEEEAVQRKRYGWAAFALVSIFGGMLIGGAMLTVRTEPSAGARRSARLELETREAEIAEAIGEAATGVEVRDAAEDER